MRLSAAQDRATTENRPRLKDGTPENIHRASTVAEINSKRRRMQRYCIMKTQFGWYRVIDAPMPFGAFF